MTQPVEPLVPAPPAPSEVIDVPGSMLVYSRAEYLALADEYLSSALRRLGGQMSIEQELRVAEIFATMSLAAAPEEAASPPVPT